MKTTGWFSVNTPPARSGWFEGRYDNTDDISKTYWYDVESGEWTCENIDGEMIPAFFGNVWKETEEWRGLIERAA